MNLKKIIKLFYVGYTIYILMVINVTSISFYTVLPSIMIMWINYFIFSTGYKVSIKKKNCYLKNSYTMGWLNNRRKITLFILAFASVVSSVLAVNYYTGQTPISTFRNIANNVSLYYEYQTYFREQQRYSFSLTKVPFILMLFYIKLITFYSYISIFIAKNRISKFDIFYIMIITTSFFYVGIARGTNFEFFEFVMMILFIILTKQKIGKFKIPFKTYMFAGLIIGSMIFIFYRGVSARGVNFDFNISRDVFYDPDGIISSLSTFLSFIVLILYGYFGFGFYYIGLFVSEVWLVSIESFIAGLIPLGQQVLGEPTIFISMRNVVDMGAKWHPDTIVMINNFGYIGLVMIIFSLGVFSRYIQKIKESKPINNLTLFIILLQMVSLPVGNFVMASSASQLIVISLVLYWIWKVIIKVKVRI